MPTSTMMAPVQPVQRTAPPVSYIYDFNTRNQSFLTMHYYLKSKGYKNNAFMLMLFDTDLVGVDPYDPNLSPLYKQKILIEIRRNLWYFIREVSRIPQSGGPPSSFQLDRANMAVLYLLQFNINIYEEIPRQCGKTQTIAAFYLWLYNFRTQSSNIVFLNKKMETTKENLQRLKDQRESLPSYLRFETVYGLDGKPLKTPNTVEYITNPINRNRINRYFFIKEGIVLKKVQIRILGHFLWLTTNSRSRPLLIFFIHKGNKSKCKQNYAYNNEDCEISDPRVH